MAIAALEVNKSAPPQTDALSGCDLLGQLTEPSPPVNTVLPKVESDPERFESFSLPGDVIRKTLDTRTREILIESDITPEHYEQLAEVLGPEHVKAVSYARTLAEQLKIKLGGRPIEEISSTGKGGGVQMILMAQMNYLQKLGLNSHWRLLGKMDQIAEKTKQWHNTFQGVRNPGIEELAEGFDRYDEWIKEPAAELAEPIAQARIIKLHDPQPHGLMPYIHGWNPEAAVVAQSHIQNRSELIAQPGSPQHYAWNRLYQNSWKHAQAIGFHPVDSFVPDNVPDEQVAFMPATFDPFDDLNRKNLIETERANGRDFIDGQLIKSNELKQLNRFAKEQVDWEQIGVDWNRPIITLIARFDPSKGMEVAIEAYARARAKMLESGMSEAEIPQLLLLGNGAPDDTDGEAELARIMELRDDEQYQAMKHDIKVGRVPHNDTALNVVMESSKFGLQSSLYEGFETRASDWIWHGKPVIVSERGGLPLQVVEGKSGHAIDPTNLNEWAERIYELTTNDQKYVEMSEWADQLGKSYNYLEFSTISNAIRQLEIYNDILDGSFHGSRKNPWSIREKLEKLKDQRNAQTGKIALVGVAT